MADKIWGSEDPVVDELFSLTQGIGFPLRSVDKLTGQTVAGDVVGPATATDDAIARFNGPTGKLIQDSTVTVSDTGVMNSAGLVSNGEAGYDDAASMGTGAEAFASKGYVDGLVQQVTTQQILAAPSFTTQEPTALDTPIQVTFGPAQSNADIDLDAEGNVTILTAGQYNARLRLQIGRTGNPGVSYIFGRVLINAVQIGDPIFTTLDDADISIPATFESVIPFAANDVLTVEIYRDSQGNNSGGIFTENSGLWGPAPSAYLTFTRTTVVT